MSHAQCVYPDGDKALLRYERIQYEFLFPFYLVADFECFLAVDDDETLHRPSGFCIYRVSRYQSYRTEPYTYSGGDVMEHFFDYIFKEANAINEILSRNVPMEPMSDSERQEFQQATTCHTFGLAFSSSSDKTRHHDHVTGEYLFPACSHCNLALKPRSCKLARSQVIHVD